MTPDEDAVWSVLRMCKGKSLAILGPEIEELTGIGYKRIQKIINDLRGHHHRLIGSGTCGYYLPQTSEELDDVEHYIKDRAIKALVTWGNLRRMSKDEMLQQLRLELKAG